MCPLISAVILVLYVNIFLNLSILLDNPRKRKPKKLMNIFGIIYAKYHSIHGIFLVNFHVPILFFFSLLFLTDKFINLIRRKLLMKEPLCLKYARGRHTRGYLYTGIIKTSSSTGKRVFRNDTFCDNISGFEFLFPDIIL